MDNYVFHFLNKLQDFQETIEECEGEGILVFFISEEIP